MKTHISIIALWMLALSGLHAQNASSSALNAGGATATTPGGATLEQAVGEMAVTTLQGTSVTLTQGVLQPGAILIDAIGPLLSDIDIQIYPNPAQDYIHIQTEVDFLKTVTIWDISGKKVQAGELEEGLVSVAHLAQASYVLGLFDTQGQLRYAWRFQKQ